MTKPQRHVEINISSIPVAGVGGAGLLIVAASITTMFPLVRWVVLFGVLGGAMIAGALIFLRRERGGGRPDGHQLGILFGDDRAGANPSREAHLVDPKTLIAPRFAPAG